MGLTFLLARVLGPYILLAGIAVFINRRHIMLGVVALAHEKGAQLTAGLLALFVGLFLVNVHNIWYSLPVGLVSAVGWGAVIKGLVYLFLPEAQLSKIMKALSDRNWYMIDGIVAVVIGLYLTAFGFGLI